MLRAIREADVARLCELNELALGYHFPLEKTREQVVKLTTAVDHVFIAYADERTDDLIGYVHAQTYESLYSDRGLNVLALAVHPDHQGRGIGGELMVALEEIARMQGYQFIRLNSGSHRVKAHAFYRKLGYDGDKTQQRFIKIFKEIS